MKRKTCAVLTSLLITALPLISVVCAGCKNEPSLKTTQFGTALDDIGDAIAVDSSDNVYVAGATEGTFPGQVPLGGFDVFVRKIDSNLKERWTRQFGTATNDSASALAADRSGNIYVAGHTSGSLPGQTLLGIPDTFVRKYDPNGKELWTRQFGTGGGSYADALAADRSDNIYVAGHTSGSLPGQTSLGGNSDAFVRKYDPNGKELWTRQFGTRENDGADRLAVDNSGNVYVAGYMGLTSSGRTNVTFVRKYDSSGQEIWTHQFDYPAPALAVDGSGNIYVAGETFVYKCDSNGDELWKRQLENFPAYGNRALAVDGSGNIYVAGCIPENKASVRKYDSNLKELWTRRLDPTLTGHISGLVSGPSGSVYLAGYLGGALQGCTLSGRIDTYVAKFAD